MLISLGQDSLLDQKREKAKSKIEELLAPVWNVPEIPKISDLDRFRHLAEPLWKSTGSNFLGDLLTPSELDRPLFEVSREIDQLKTISDFVIQAPGSPWTNWGTAFALPQLDWATTSIPPFTIDSIKTAAQPNASDALWENLYPSAFKKLDDYLSELTAGLGVAEDAYYLTVSEFDPWQEMESYAPRRATSYISRLVYLHRALEKLLAAADSAESTPSLFLFHSTRESCKVTPQVSKRPPPPSTPF